MTPVREHVVRHTVSQLLPRTDSVNGSPAVGSCWKSNERLEA